MLTVRKSNRKRTLLLTAAVFTALVCLVTSLMFASKTGIFSENNVEDTDNSINETGEDTTPDNSNIKETSDDEIKPDVRNPSGEGGNKPVSEGGSTEPKTLVSSINAVVDSAEVNFQTIIQKPANTGSCTLVLSSGAKRIERSAGISQLGSNSTCKGFVLNRSELSSGKWEANLSINIGEEKGSSSTSFSL